MHIKKHNDNGAQIKKETSTPFFNQQSQLNAGGFFHALGYTPGLVMRQEASAAEPITDEQIRSAIIYNRVMYPPNQLRILQHTLGVAETGRSDRATALAIATYQSNISPTTTIDGKAGPDTFSAIHSDSNFTNLEDLIIFNVQGSRDITLTTGSGTTDMLGHFNVDIMLPPGNCEDYEYRQFICGNVEFLPANASATTPFISLNSLFTTQPGGSLPSIPNFHQDGNTTLNSVYGKRDRPARPENKYVNADGTINQATGCRFLGEDFPGITGRVTNTGETYDFDFRFMGEVRHKTRGRVAERWWNIQSTFVV